MKAFKAYDIRGEWEIDFNAEDVYRIGFFLPGILKANTILVGRDLRHSSDTVFNALSRGITDAGANYTMLDLHNSLDLLGHRAPQL